MTIYPVPAAQQLISSVIGMSRCYVSLHELRQTPVDPLFLEPAGQVLGLCGESHLMDMPSIERTGSHLSLVRNPIEVARYITDRGPHYRGLWKFRLHQSPPVKRELWSQILRAAEGFIAAGYHTYDVVPVSRGWAEEVMSIGLGQSQ